MNRRKRVNFARHTARWIGILGEDNHIGDCMFEMFECEWDMSEADSDIHDEDVPILLEAMRAEAMHYIFGEDYE